MWASHRGRVAVRTRAYLLFSLNHSSTAALFSFTHLMLPLVFSRACSRARVAEPKPVSMLFFLNCSSCQGKEGLSPGLDLQHSLEERVPQSSVPHPQWVTQPVLQDRKAQSFPLPGTKSLSRAEVKTDTASGQSMAPRCS